MSILDYFAIWIPYVLIAAWWLALVGGGIYGLYALRRFLRAYERRATGGPELTTLADRVRLLEDALERVEANVERLAEGQQFTTKLLEERAASAAPRGPRGG